MGQGSSKERFKNAAKKLSSLELANIEAVFDEISTKSEDGTRHVELSLINRQDFAERFRLPGFIAERLFHAFDRNEVKQRHAIKSVSAGPGRGLFILLAVRSMFGRTLFPFVADFVNIIQRKFLSSPCLSL